MRFTVKPPETNDLLLLELHTTAGELKGEIEILGKQKTGTVSLTRASLAGK